MTCLYAARSSCRLKSPVALSGKKILSTKVARGAQRVNNVIGSIHYYLNILFLIVCLLCIQNVVGAKHDVPSVLYQHCQYEVMIHLVYVPQKKHYRNTCTG